MLEPSSSIQIGGAAVKPVSHSVEADEEPPRASAESALRREIRSLGEQVTRLAPACRGMSVTWTEHTATFTLVASDPEIAVLDALQYLGGGPADDVVARQQGIEADIESLLRENSWTLFARATLARGVRSILALPLTQHGRVIGAVTFHGRTADAFDGTHAEIARVLAAWAPTAIALTTPVLPESRTVEPPRALRDEGMINRAIATMAAARGVDTVATKELLGDAAARAGVSQGRVAEAVLQVHP